MPAIELATHIVSTLQQKGHIAYFAGGWVRDFLLNVPSDDIDIATSASVEEIQSLFPKTIPVGIAFGIIIVVEGGHSFEVATFRKEKEYVDGRRPTSIEPTTPEKDALRRDFTINGLFYDPLKNLLLDYVEGQKDIQKGIIRAIGNAHDRFLEDRLRMMRAVRYSTRFQFPIEIDTREAIIYHAKSLFPSVAMERVWQEFQKMSTSKHFSKGLLALHELTLLPVIFPSLKDISSQELEKRISPLASLAIETPLIAKLLFLFPGSSLEQSLELCDYLKLSKAEKELVRFLSFSKSLLTLPLDWQSNLEKAVLATFYANAHSALALEVHSFSQDNPSYFFEFHKKMKQSLDFFIRRIQTKDPLLKAEDLQKEGILPGMQMGRLLKEAEKISINENIQEKDDLLHRLKKTNIWTDKNS